VILFQKHIDYYNSLTPREYGALKMRDLLYDGDWEKTRSKIKIPEYRAMMKKLSEYETKHGIDLGFYALQDTLGDKHGKRK
jgi:hypothetical protein